MSQSFIHFQKEGENNPGYLRQREPPYIIGKVIKLRKQDEADNYAAKQVNYTIGRVEGYNIFITHAGFFEKPETLVPDSEIVQAIEDMAQWYYKNKVENKKMVIKEFKIKN
jgi:hypothetical protein